MPRKKKEKKVKEVAIELAQDVTRSFMSYVGMEAHGGRKFDMMEIKAILTAKNVPAEEVAEVSAALFAKCKATVEADIAAIDAALEGTEDAVPAKKAKREKKTPAGLDKEEIEEISETINAIINADSSEALLKVGKEVKKMDLSTGQSSYLKALYIKASKKLKTDEGN